jgi:tetratricopeptide (TPR) repeat protein
MSGTEKGRGSRIQNKSSKIFYLQSPIFDLQSSLIWPILPVVFLALGGVAQNWMDSHRPAPLAVEKALYVSSGESIKRASLGFDGLMADVYWIRALLYFGEEFERQRVSNQYFDVSRLKLLQPLLDITVDLDPHHVAAYRFGAVFLPDIDTDAAVRFVERGIRNNPGEWRLYQDLGFVHWRRSRFREAAEAYARGAALPGAPAWMRTMPALMLAKGGERETARAMFLRLYEESDDPFIKQICEEQLSFLDQNMPQRHRDTETGREGDKGARGQGEK